MHLQNVVATFKDANKNWVCFLNAGYLLQKH
jgi:hypothetical protein